MNAIMLQPIHSIARDAKIVPFRPGVPADSLTSPGAINGPEIALQVSFVGLDAAAQQMALASFPGARRCSLSTN